MPALRTRATLARMRNHSCQELQRLFANSVPCPAKAPGTRTRLYGTAATFWLFLFQVLNANISCAETVLKAVAQAARLGAPGRSANTSAYCQARARLGIDALRAVLRKTIDRLCENEKHWTWKNLRVRILDGSGLSMPDTPSNRKAWPPSGNTAPGCGFPVMRVVVLFSLATGAIVDFAHAHLRVSERALGRLVWKALRKGDVLLADCGFCALADFAKLAQRGVHCVMVKHQRRKHQRTIERLGRNDRIVAWMKTGACPKWMTPAEWKALPKEFIVREVLVTYAEKGFRSKSVTIVTTLLDAKNYTADDLAQLYRMRWKAELFLRDIKITLGMDVLKCKSPAMIEKEVVMFLLAYNLLRTLMLQAARSHQLHPTQISFTHAISAVRHWSAELAAAPARLRPLMRKEMLRALAARTVADRPDRTEPRAIKRRSKNYQLLNKPRHSFKEIPHRNKYVARP